ncbi:MAG: FAA hydrolase family protein [Alphaproteobacteria bacterium]|nr:MAG: FAA hydrolase family protein [Alphaproteobacteria bacterium]
MSAFVFTPPPRPAARIHGSNRLFPVRRVLAIGRNYADHAAEMGTQVTRGDPFFFAKPSDGLVFDGATIPYPDLTSDLHHEAELVVALGSGGRNIPAGEALSHVWGYAAGIDLTRRDLQATAKKAGRPWMFGKNFDNSAVLGDLVPVEVCGHRLEGRLALSVNGTLRQESDLSAMVWSVAEIIAELSRGIALAAGDLIYTGTPAGVGPLVEGDCCTVEVEGLPPASVRIGPPLP